MNGGNAPNPSKLTQPPTPLSSQPPSNALINQPSTSTPLSKSLDQQSTSDAGKGLSQTVTSTKGTLSDPSSNPNTKNENITTVENIKTKEISSIWCIGPNKNCDITGIGIIVISISITLAIMYKYLSFEWRKELKKTEKLKKIINLFGVNKTEKTIVNSTGRKKQMQIIINSPTQKKQTKKSINPVYREKSPLLKNETL
ncbi:CIR protein PIR protein, fragment [Plasmodium vinckei brucechwatti]|uniref:CIR protein PIR protein n=1 Tax=Plasmodium vinckei brucechwatti TaxID=119398 RepID=A0A6V7S1M8_PLAVN|nr:CIR protein PIR protein, fragment [Plasmodium vinckei brucechwatti]